MTVRYTDSNSKPYSTAEINAARTARTYLYNDFVMSLDEYEAIRDGMDSMAEEDAAYLTIGHNAWSTPHEIDIIEDRGDEIEARVGVRPA